MIWGIEQSGGTERLDKIEHPMIKDREQKV